MRMYRSFFLLLISFVIIASCSSQNRNVWPDSEFNRLFTRSGGGLTGADGTYSVLLPDGRTVWIFGDTFLGTVNPDSTREKTDPMYIRNSFAVQDDSRLTTLYTKTAEGNRSLMIPPEVLNSKGEITEDSLWYWPGDGLVANRQLKVFVSKFEKDGEGMWGFKWTGTVLITFSLPGLNQIDLQELPMSKVDSIHFGHAVLEEESYTYIYGMKNGKPYAARAPERKLGAGWEYFTDDGWSKDISEAIPVLDSDGSEQFSVVKLDQEYYLITQRGGLSNEIWAYHSGVPYDWKPENGKRIHTIEMPFDNPDLFTYNALAHPQFIDDNDSILISYNMNSHNLEDHFRNAHIYKPRFVRIPIENLK